MRQYSCRFILIPVFLLGSFFKEPSSGQQSLITFIQQVYLVDIRKALVEKPPRVHAYHKFYVVWGRKPYPGEVIAPTIYTTAPRAVAVPSRQDSKIAEPLFESAYVNKEAPLATYEASVDISAPESTTRSQDPTPPALSAAVASNSTRRTEEPPKLEVKQNEEDLAPSTPSNL